jgi:hypothetical protein
MLTENQKAQLLLIIVLILGLWMRLNPVLTAGFPMNDGGMFFTMIDDLRRNHYNLPVYTTYNNQNIPFAYPPLAFYMAGFLADALHISLFQVLLWLPALFNIATLPAFYLLASTVMKSPLKAALATLIYMLSPLSMDWFLMGGGLTRGMGQLFLILTCWSASQLFQQPSRKMLALTILNGALLVLCHPESALLALVCVGIIWAFSARSKKSIGNGLLAGLGIAVLISPWLVTVLHTHGVEPFLKAAQTNGSQLLLWTKVFTFDFTQEPLPGFVAVLGLVGLFISISQKKYLLPLWVIIPFFVNPRSSARAAILPLAMLAALALLDVILPAIGSYEAKVTGKTGNKTGILLSVYILLSMLGGMYTLGLNMAANRLSEADQQAFVWVQQNTTPDVKFVIITGEFQLLRDPLQEWFPALTGRTSQTTLQGREWVWGDKFIQSIVTFDGLQRCISQDAQCIEAETQKLEIPFEYLYIKKPTVMQCSDGEICRYNGKTLVEELRKSPAYKLIYENDSAAIFGKIKSNIP